jgi:hypothetical protein
MDLPIELTHIIHNSCRYKSLYDLIQISRLFSLNIKDLYIRINKTDKRITTQYRNKLHSINNEPSIKRGNCQVWHKNGQLHRIDGPARILLINSKIHKWWYQNDVLHRIDGPAVEKDDYKEWWVDGKKIK